MPHKLGRSFCAIGSSWVLMESFRKVRARACQPCASAARRCGFDPPTPTPNKTSAPKGSSASKTAFAPKRKRKRDADDVSDDEDSVVKKGKNRSEQGPVTVVSKNSDSDSELSLDSDLDLDFDLDSDSGAEAGSASQQKNVAEPKEGPTPPQESVEEGSTPDQALRALANLWALTDSVGNVALQVRNMRQSLRSSCGLEGTPEVDWVAPKDSGDKYLYND